ncbi:MAG: DMT family transporter [Muribaculaceae bacterium]|nr:DMT family transporter [Muribaculaceae bacterium]MDE6628533.1 DMT family transporter [Muribaculaceae bacterium]
MVNKKITGSIVGLIAAVTYGLNPLFALPLQAEGMETETILFFRYLFAIPIVGIMMVARGRTFRVGGRQAGMLMLMGVLMGLSSLLLFESYRMMDAGIASTLLFIYPLMVAVIMGSLYGERMGITTWLCLLGATVGIALLYDGEGGEASLSLWGTMTVMASALCYAIYIVGVNKSSLSRLPTLTVTFYCLLTGLLVFVVPAIWHGGLGVPHGAGQWLRIGALALLPTAVSLTCTTMAISLVGSTVTAILGAMEPVTAVIIGISVFGEKLTAKDTAGLVLIVAAVTLVVVGGRMARNITKIKKMLPRRRRH